MYERISLYIISINLYDASIVYLLSGSRPGPLLSSCSTALPRPFGLSFSPLKQAWWWLKGIRGADQALRAL